MGRFMNVVFSGRGGNSVEKVLWAVGGLRGLLVVWMQFIVYKSSFLLTVELFAYSCVWELSYSK